MTRTPAIASLIPASQDLYRKIVFEIADGIIGIDEAGIIRLCNPAAEALFGWKAGELLDKPLEVLLPHRVRASHGSLVQRFQAGSSDTRYMGQRDAAIIGLRADGSEIHLAITILRTSAANEPMMIAAIRDVSEHVRYQRDLKRLADLDPLSGLLNRRAFRNRVAQHLSEVSPRNCCVALFDLDDFKGVNDRFGHDAGDEGISRFAATMETSIRQQDLAARWGGEEFILFMPETSLNAAKGLVETIRHRFEAVQFDWAQKAAASLTASAGLAVAGNPLPALDAMIACADAALYRAKHAGRNRQVTTVMQPEALAS